MSDKNVASIRELRTNFRRIKQKVEDYGKVVITDRGDPAYVLRAVRPKRKKRPPPPDYYARLIKRQPRPISAEASRLIWETERGDRVIAMTSLADSRFSDSNQAFCRIHFGR